MWMHDPMGLGEVLGRAGMEGLRRWHDVHSRCAMPATCICSPVAVFLGPLLDLLGPLLDLTSTINRLSTGPRASPAQCEKKYFP